ncbi:MAG: hypothetical protein ACJAX5_003260, partial [Patiriisocius sp.]
MPLIIVSNVVHQNSEIAVTALSLISLFKCRDI